MKRVYAGAAGILLGVGGTMVLRDATIPDSNAHPVTAGMTTSGLAVAESSMATVDTPTQQTGDSSSATSVAPDDNNGPDAPGQTADEGESPERPSNLLEVSAPGGPVDDNPAATVNEEQRIEKLLSQAAAAIEEHRLTNPKNNNAYFYYQRVLELHPGNENAQTGIDNVAGAYAELAEHRLRRHNYDAAEKYLRRGLTIRPENTRLLALQQEANIGHLLARASMALKEYRLTTPKNDNAYYYYQRVLELQPNHEGALQGITRIANAYADLAESKLDQFEYEAAKQYLHRGLTIQPHNTRLQELQKNTNAFRDAPGRILKKIFSPFS
jgi:serine/threonine-protein kinase PpkA